MKVFRGWSPINFLIVGGWASLTVLAFFGHVYRHDLVVACAIATYSLGEVVMLRVRLKEAERIPPNTVLLSTPSEPSSDARQAARLLTDYRMALINEGMSPREATEFLTSWAAKAGGES